MNFIWKVLIRYDFRPRDFARLEQVCLAWKKDIRENVYQYFFPSTLVDYTFSKKSYYEKMRTLKTDEIIIYDKYVLTKNGYLSIPTLMDGKKVRYIQVELEDIIRAHLERKKLYIAQVDTKSTSLYSLDYNYVPPMHFYHSNIKVVHRIQCLDYQSIKPQYLYSIPMIGELSLLNIADGFLPIFREGKLYIFRNGVFTKKYKLGVNQITYAKEGFFYPHQHMEDLKFRHFDNVEAELPDIHAVPQQSRKETEENLDDARKSLAMYDDYRIVRAFVNEKIITHEGSQLDPIFHDKELYSWLADISDENASGCFYKFIKPTTSLIKNIVTPKKLYNMFCQARGDVIIDAYDIITSYIRKKNTTPRYDLRELKKYEFLPNAQDIQIYIIAIFRNDEEVLDVYTHEPFTYSMYMYIIELFDGLNINDVMPSLTKETLMLGFMEYIELESL